MEGSSFDVSWLRTAIICAVSIAVVHGTLRDIRLVNDWTHICIPICVIQDGMQALSFSSPHREAFAIISLRWLFQQVSCLCCSYIYDRKTCSCLRCSLFLCALRGISRACKHTTCVVIFFFAGKFFLLTSIFYKKKLPHCTYERAYFIQAIGINAQVIFWMPGCVRCFLVIK